MSLEAVKATLEECKLSSNPIKINAGSRLSMLIDNFEKKNLSKMELASKVIDLRNHLLTIRTDEGKLLSNICKDVLKYT